MTGSLTVFGASLSAGAGEDVSPPPDAIGSPASCAASAQQAATRMNLFARTCKLSRARDDSELFMGSELLRQISLSCEGQFSSMPERSTARKLRLSKSFSRKQPRPIHKFRPANSLPSLKFDG